MQKSKLSAKGRQLQKFILDVPYYSQYSNIKNKRWQSRSCGIVCLKMVLDYFGEKINRKIPPLDNLIRESEFINGFGKFGSNHEALVMIARNYGFQAYRQEFRSLINDYKNKKIYKSQFENDLIDSGIKKIIKKIKNGQPVIISAVKNFSETNKFHMVVLIGFKKINNKLTGFYYHDSDFKKKNKGADKFVPIEIFNKHWRKFSIFINI